jgi:hypothetical protein
MRHPFIKKAKKNAYLMDLIDRYRKWKLTRGDESESDSGGESGGDETGGDDSDTDWNMTVKGPPSSVSSYAEPLRSGGDGESIGYSAPVNSISDKERGSSLSRPSCSTTLQYFVPFLCILVEAFL